VKDYEKWDKESHLLSSAQLAQVLVPKVGRKFTGQSMRRKEDPVLLTGHGTFVDDVKFPGMLFAGIVRSSYGHARIRNIDLEPALKLPGVLFAVSGNEIRKETRPLPLSEITPRMKSTEVYSLAVDKVHFVGEPVAAVLAEDRYVAEDAIAHVAIDYEPLPCVVDAERGLDTDSPKLYEEWGTNEMLHHKFRIGNLEEAFSKSDYVIKEKITRHRYTAAPIECRGYLANYDSYSNTLTYYASTQSPHILRTLVAQTLDFPEDRIRVIAPHVGGGFGEKLPLYQEEPLIAFLSWRMHRPVKWIETRTENLSSACHSRQQVHYVEIGVSRDGKINAVRDNMFADLGAFSPQPGIDSPLATTRFITSGYKVENYAVDLHAVCTNKSPYGAVRGFGKADANFVMERMMNIAAKRIGMDPVQFRLKNFVQPHEFPYQSCTGAIYDSGNYPGNLLKAVETIGYAEFRRSQEALRKKDILQGISVSFLLEPSALTKTDSVYTGYESATIRVDPSGNITVYTGVATQGQGHETALSQIIADELGVEPQNVSVQEGDTTTSPYGLGNFSSRFSIAGVGAVMMACDAVKRKIAKIASSRLGISEGEIVFENGRIGSLNSDAKMSIPEIAEIAYKKIHLLPAGLKPGIDESAYYVSPNAKFIPDEKGRLNLYPSYTGGAYAVVVEVDAETGKVSIVKQVFVSDCGNIINPLMLDGQHQGGLVQGIGGAMFEDLVYDSEGQLLSSTFMDYLIPSSMEVPDSTIVHMMTPSPLTRGGFKGGAEGGCIVAPYGLTNAVDDALNTIVLRQPLSPENVWREISKKRE
jgi:aerobic carbon-monoxide dehydrogenase large subunit